MPHTAPLSTRFGRSASFVDLSVSDDKRQSSSHVQSRSDESGPLSARPAFRTGSFASQQQQPSFPSRPSLYALPSYAGSTESTRLNDSIWSSIYGSSCQSTASFLSSVTATSTSTLDTHADALRFYATPNRKRVHQDSAFASGEETESAPSSIFSSGSSAPSMGWSASSSGRRNSTDEGGPVTPTPVAGAEHPYFPGSPSKSDISYFSSGSGSAGMSDISMSPEKRDGEFAKAPRLFIHSPSRSPEGKSRFSHARSASAHLTLQNSWILPQKGEAAPQLMTLESPFGGSYNLTGK